jgi:hypothetical protein
MINKLIPIILISLLGCSQSEIEHPGVIYIGDSLCAAVYDSVGATAQQQVGINSDCLSGRKIVEYGLLPPGYETYFLALATNDVGETPIQEYGDSLQSKLDSVDGPIWCVLPMDLPSRFDAIPYRERMQSMCANVIDPIEWGVGPRANDGLHWNDLDHSNFVGAINYVLGE